MNDLAQRHADAFEGTAARMAELLAPFTPLERVRPRRPEDAEVLALAGVSRHALYRLVASGAIACERGQAPTRRDGRRGAARIFVTLADVAAYRAARFVPINEKAVTVSPATAKGENNEQRHSRIVSGPRQLRAS